MQIAEFLALQRDVFEDRTCGPSAGHAEFDENGDNDARLSSRCITDEPRVCGAVRPIGATLALWIVYSANDGDRHTMADFSQGLLLGILPTIGFLIVTWLAARAGLKLASILLVGYAVWGIGVGLMFVVRKLMGT